MTGRFALCPAPFVRMRFICILELCLLALLVILFQKVEGIIIAGENTAPNGSISSTALFSPSSFICDYYASPTGLGSGNGTLSNPWSLQTALNNTTTIITGKTLCLQGGTYRGKFRSILNGGTVRTAPNEYPIIDGYVYTTLIGSIDDVQTTFTVANASVFTSSLSGGASHGVIIDGEAFFVTNITGNTITADRAAGGSSTGAVAHSSGALVRLAGNQLLVEGNDTTYWGFECMNSDPLRNWQTDGAEGLRGTGIFNTGNGNKFVNLNVHDNLSGIFSGSSSSNTEVYGCLSYNNGMNDPAANPPGKGHGMYLENSAGYLRAYDNIVLNNFNNGMQLYGRSAASVGGDLQGNAVANSGAPLASVPYQRNRNMILGTETQRMPDIIVKNNYLFHPHEVNGSNCTFGYGSGIDNGYVTDNYFVGGGGVGLELGDVTAVTVTGNKFFTTNSVGINIQSGEYPYTVNDNTYYSVHSTSREFGDTTTAQTLIFAVWKAVTGFDLTSTITSSEMPDTAIVRPNAYQAGRANIIVYTSSGGSSINVDLSPAALMNGQSYTIINAFNYGGGPVSTGVFNSASPTISLLLNGAAASVATPVGATYAPSSTLPQFGAFILIPSSIPGTPTPTNTPTNSPTNTATSTPTATPVSFVTGTVTYGNAVGSPNPRFVSNVLISGTGVPSGWALTSFPNGTYSLGVGLGTYIVTPSKTGGQNGAVSSFDAAKISAFVTGHVTFTSAQQVAADVSGNGSINSFDAAQVACYTISSPPYGIAGTWKFSPVNRTYLVVGANLAGEDYLAFLMGDVSGNWNNTGARPASTNGSEKSIAIAAPYFVTPTDNEIIVPVSVQGIANKGIISYEFDLRYDPRVIRPLSDAVETTGTVSRGLFSVSNPEESGLLRVAVYGPMPIEGNGILLNLKFAPVGAPGSASSLVWERFILNEGENQIVVTNGAVQLSAVQPTVRRLYGTHLSK